MKVKHAIAFLNAIDAPEADLVTFNNTEPHWPLEDVNAMTKVDLSKYPKHVENGKVVVVLHDHSKATLKYAASLELTEFDNLDTYFVGKEVK